MLTDDINLEVVVPPAHEPLLTPEPTKEDKRVAQNKSPILMNVCEEQTKFHRDDEKKCSKYKFEYGNTAFGNGSIDLIRSRPSLRPNPRRYKKILSWQELNNLRVDQEWDTIRHPYVLHFINQKLLDCAGFYTAHITVATLLFFLLAWHIISPDIIKDVLIFIMTAAVAFVLVLKCTTKARHNLVSPWFVLGSAFNYLTYAATFAYIIIPHVAKFDDENMKMKKEIIWSLPIFAIISTWLNLLYVLRKTPFGIYVLMLTRIWWSFLHIAVIWIPTLITFSFVFLLVMRGSGVPPWPPLSSDSTDFHNATFEILQAITKTSTMMLGEVDANAILETKKWIPSILVLVFEIITVILLMNLMVSLAVGDVDDLKKEAEDTILKIKLNYVIEALQLREEFNKVYHLEPATSKNGLVIHDNGKYLLREVDFEKTNFVDMHEDVEDNWWMIYSKWLIGLDMAVYLQNAPPVLQQP
ncbi:hypothetical protein CAEBREN_25101 [Caenorhabditis brenneri]|uniref:Ion transport domain-containing protein n=1 Tax=Caenorhabditis brenneri TaxID=135651 RepID=G0P4S4_CAEBE|nr:hypothetical protein CAEBREN_25101 [Caenorhabditis brenneri]